MGFKTYPLYMFCLIILVVNMVIQVQEILNIRFWFIELELLPPCLCKNESGTMVKLKFITCNSFDLFFSVTFPVVLNHSKRILHLSLL